MEHSNTTNSSNGERGVMDRVKSSAAAQLSSQKDRATAGLGSFAEAVRKTSQPLRDSNQDTIAGFVDKAADQIDRFSTRLRQREVGELMEDAQRFARRQPALFIGGAFAVGLLAARFLKSSGDNRANAWARGDRSTPGPDRTRALASGYAGGSGYGGGGL